MKLLSFICPSAKQALLLVSLITVISACGDSDCDPQLVNYVDDDKLYIRIQNDFSNDIISPLIRTTFPRSDSRLELVFMDIAEGCFSEYVQVDSVNRQCFLFVADNFDNILFDCIDQDVLYEGYFTYYVTDRFAQLLKDY